MSNVRLRLERREPAASGTTLTRLSAVEADVITAQATADDAVVDTRLLAWGLRTDPISGEPVIPVIETAANACFLYLWPGNSGTYRNGEAQIYVPVGNSNKYFGIGIGVRGRSAYSVPFEVFFGIFQPGLHTLAASCTRTGTWASSANAGALHGTYYYSDTAGSKYSATVTGEIVAAQLWQSTNGGFSVVTIDGSDSFASPLPVFSATDLANGLCRAQDVGKHYISQYTSFAWDHTQVIATGLSAGSHLVEVEVTGTKPAASSSVRVWAQALVGCTASTSVTNANTHMVPVKMFMENWGTGGIQSYMAMQWAPSGSSDWQFLTGVHADNTNCKEASISGPTIYVDSTDRSGASTGTYYSGFVIQWRQKSQASHKDDFLTYVVERDRIITAMAGRQFPFMYDVTLNWLTNGTMNNAYPVMLPLAFYDYQRRTQIPAVPPVGMWLGNSRTTAVQLLNNSLVAHGQQSHVQTPLLVGQYADALIWAKQFRVEPDIHMQFASKGTYVFSSRSDGTDKGYISAAYQSYWPVSAGDSHRWLFGFGAGLITDMPS